MDFPTTFFQIYFSFLFVYGNELTSYSMFTIFLTLW
jgi:hypothetical protein